MKRKIVLFTALAGFMSIALSSFHAGMKTFNAAHPGAITANPLTGIVIESNTVAVPTNCGGDGVGHSPYSCHDQDNNLSVNTTIYENATYTTLHAINNFQPNHKYYIQVTGDYSVTASHDTAFGFQCTLYGWHAGTTGPITPGLVWSGEADVTVDTTNLYGAITVDQKNTLTNHGTSGNKFHFQARFPWTSPDAASTIDSIHIRTLMCAVDGDATATGDAHNGGPLILLHKEGVSVKEVFKNAGFNTYPNPATNNINIKMDNLADGNYVMYAYDMNGKKILHRDIEVTGNTHTESINMASWSAGAYFIQVARHGEYKNISIVKQ